MSKSQFWDQEMPPYIQGSIFKKKRPNSIGSAHALPGPEDITRAELPNGIIVLSRSNFNSPSVVVSGYLVVGGLFDPDEKLGLADFTSSALMRGTSRRDFQGLYDALESVGASMGFSGGTHTTGFGGRALAEELDLLLELLSEILREPSFPERQLKRLQSQVLTSLAIRAQSTSDMASLAFDKVLYGNHPYSRPEDGYPETVAAISREDVVQFHRENYGPQGTVITVVGAVDPSEAVEKVASVLGDWENESQPEPPQLPPLNSLEATVREVVTIPGKSQADVVMGVAGPPRQSPDYLAAALGNSILGQFGMMGRIGNAVREKAGLAYYAHSSLGGGIGPGPWRIRAGVDPDNVEKAIDMIRQEIRRFVEKPVSKEELADSQANFTGKLPLSLESNGWVASSLLNLERYRLGLDYYQRFPALVRAVTVEDVQEIASRYFHQDRLAIAIAGP